MKISALIIVLLTVLIGSTPAALGQQQSGYNPPSFPDIWGHTLNPDELSIPLQILRAAKTVRLGRQNMADAADRLAGGAVIDSHTGRRGIPGAPIALGGLFPSRTVVYLDGIRLPGGPYGVDLEQIPLHYIDRVEVLYGPRSAPYGPGAEAGVVRILTSMPQKPTTADIDLSYGSYSEVRLSAHNSYKPNWFGYLIAVEHTSGDGWYDEFAPDPIVPPISPGQLDPPDAVVSKTKDHRHAAYDLFLKMEADAGPTEVLCMGRYHYDRNMYQNDHQGNRNDRGYQFDYQCGISGRPGIVDLSFMGSGSMIESRANQVIPRFAFDPDPVPRWQEWNLSVDTYKRNALHRTQAGWGVQIARQHRIEGGLDFRGETMDGRSHVRAEDIDGGAPFGSDRIGGGLFLESRNGFFSSLLVIEPGLRVDFSDRFDPQYSGHLGFLAKPHELIDLRLDGGRAWFEPDIGRSSHDFLRGDRLLIIGNPELNVESSWGGTFEISLGHVQGPWLIACMYFHNEIDDAIVTRPQDKWFDGTPAVKNQNVGKARSYGAVGRFEIAPIRWLLIRGDYTFTQDRLLDIQDDRDRDEPLGAVPPHVSHLEIGFDIYPIKLNISSRLGYFGEWQRRLPDGRIVWVDDRFELGARAGRTFGSHVELFVEGYNLLFQELDMDGDGDNDLMPTWAMGGLRIQL